MNISEFFCCGMVLIPVGYALLKLLTQEGDPPSAVHDPVGYEEYQKRRNDGGASGCMVWTIFILSSIACFLASIIVIIQYVS